MSKGGLAQATPMPAWQSQAARDPPMDGGIV